MVWNSQKADRSCQKDCVWASMEIICSLFAHLHNSSHCGTWLVTKGCILSLTSNVVFDRFDRPSELKLYHTGFPFRIPYNESQRPKSNWLTSGVWYKTPLQVDSPCHGGKVCTTREWTLQDSSPLRDLKLNTSTRTPTLRPLLACLNFRTPHWILPWSTHPPRTNQLSLPPS
jgi:hypothetical protein